MKFLFASCSLALLGAVSGLKLDSHNAESNVLQDDLKAFEESWTSIDKDGNGELTKDEFKKAFNSKNKEAKKDNMRDFDKADADKNGVLSKEETKSFFFDGEGSGQSQASP